MDEAAQLIEEIQQITTQYKHEVDGRRKQWPRAIKERVFRLQDLGMKFKEIESRTGISYHTVASWSGARKKFHQLPVVAGRRLRKEIATVTVARKPKIRAVTKVATVTVRTPDGFVLHLASLRDTLALLKAVRGGR